MQTITPTADINAGPSGGPAVDLARAIVRPSHMQQSLTIEPMAVARLRPYGGNARTHSKKQVRQIADSIQKFGFTNPVLVSDDDEIIAGHGRVEAAKLLGVFRRFACLTSMPLSAGRMSSPTTSSL